VILATQGGQNALASAQVVPANGTGGPIHRVLLAATDPPHPAPAGFPESWGLTHSDVRDIIGGLIVALLLLVVLVLRVRRRRRANTLRAPEASHHAFPMTAESWRGSGLADESTAPLPRFEASSVVVSAVERGWHPVQGDATRLAYWDGARWSAFRQWDGTQWVDPTVVRA
jgi:hypothetical protein